MSVLQQINRDLDELANVYATGNAHGIPVNKTGSVRIVDLRHLKFDPSTPIEVTNPHTPEFLRELADILERYFST